MGHETICGDEFNEIIILSVEDDGGIVTACNRAWVQLVPPQTRPDRKGVGGLAGHIHPDRRERHLLGDAVPG